MLPSCQLSQWLLLGSGTELGLTSGTDKGSCPFLVQSCSPGRENCYSEILSEANHEWSILSYKPPGRFQHLRPTSSQCLKKKMWKYLLVCSLIGKIHFILNLLCDSMFHQVDHKKLNYWKGGEETCKCFKAYWELVQSWLCIRLFT